MNADANERETKPSESTYLAVGGAGFLALAGFFLWRDLALPPAAVLIAAAVAASIAAAFNWPRRLPGLAPAALLVVAAWGGVWYLAIKSPALLPGLCVTAVGAIAALAIREAGSSWYASVWTRRLAWYAAGAAFLIATWALYFHLFTIGVAAETVVRRLIPTMVWLAVGLALLVAGRSRSAPPAQAGLGLMAVALIKALLYDTTHMYGPSRVALLGAVGFLLLAGAGVLRRAQAQAPAPRTGGA
jgi:hypothetical protein